MKYGKKFKYAELFAGILGFGTAIDRLGGENVFMSEIDEYAQQTIKALKPNGSLYGDIRKIKEENIPYHDLLVAGFPCQAFSVAGKRLGFLDMRGTLFFEVLRIAKYKKPKVILLENVKGLINHNDGDTLSVMMHSLNEIGYNIDFTILNSKYFDVPQNRERIYIVAVRDDLVDFEKWKNDIKGSTILPKAKRRLQKDGVKSFNFKFPSQEYVSKELTDILEDEIDESYYLSDEKLAELLHSKMPKSLSEAEGLWIREATEIGYSIARVGDSVNILFPKSKTRRGRVGHKIANTIEANTCNQGVIVSVEIDGVEHYKIKKLTPKEYWRLQSFPDESFEKAKATGLSDTQLYKQAGNAVTVSLVESLMHSLLKYI